MPKHPYPLPFTLHYPLPFTWYLGLVLGLFLKILVLGVGARTRRHRACVAVHGLTPPRPPKPFQKPMISILEPPGTSPKHPCISRHLLETFWSSPAPSKSRNPASGRQTPTSRILFVIAKRTYSTSLASKIHPPNFKSH